MRLSKHFMVLCFMLANLSTAHSDYAPYWIYGLFSMSSCDSRFPFSCSNAIANQQLMDLTIEKNNGILKTKMDFCAQDVGHSQRKMLNSLLPGLFKGSFNLTGNCINPTMTGVHQNKALFVYTHVTFELTQLVSSILLPFDIPLLAITYQQIYPASFLANPLYVYSYEASFGQEIHKTGINNFRKQLNITIAAVLNLVEPDESAKIQSNRTTCDSQDQGAFCTYVELEISDSCMKERSVVVSDDQDLNRTLEIILHTERLSFILIQGPSHLQTEFQVKMQSWKRQDKRLQNLFFINFEIIDENPSSEVTSLAKGRYGDGFKSFDNIYNLPGALGLNTLVHYLHHLKAHFLTRKFFESVDKFYDINLIAKALINIDPGKYKILKWLKLKPKYWDRIPTKAKNQVFEALKHSKQIITAYLKFWRAVFYVNLIEIEKVYRTYLFDPRNALKAQPVCRLTIPQCGKGTYLSHSYYAEVNWTRSFGYHCLHCPNGFFKPESGNTECIQCPKYHLSSPDRKSCYDPYTTVYLSFGQSDSLLVYAIISSFHGLFILLTFVTFHRNQFTPLVRASQKSISYFQIATHILLTFIPLWLFEGAPNTAKCIARPISIGILFSITTSINLGKTQKVLRIFGSQLRMSRKDIIVTRATEIFVVIFVVLLDGGVLVVTMAGRGDIGMHVTHYKDTLQKEYHCSNNTAVLIQYAFILIVIITNAIQGIRARKLPSYYRETVYVIYASFTSSVVIIASLALYLSQSSENARTVVLLITCLILNIEHFALVYVYKLYVLLLRRDINRSSVFRRERQKKINDILVQH